jgi:hypothetical protein
MLAENAVNPSVLDASNPGPKSQECLQFSGFEKLSN